MDLLQTILALLVTLGILVTVHEAGHFYVARACGVRVLRFSVGMGPVLFSRHDRRGTEFAVSALPIGGYVRMLDGREMDVAASERDEAFDSKTPLQRIAISLGGPVANFLLAILVYWVLFVSGTSGFAPITGEVPADTPAARAGMRADTEIVAVDGRSTPTWQAVNLALVERLGETGTIRVEARALDGGAARRHELAIDRWLADEDEPDTLGSLGLVPGFPAVLGSVVADGPAARAGVRDGDRIVAVDGEAIRGWGDWVRVVRAAPEQALAVEIERDSVRRTLTVVPEAREAGGEGEAIGFVGTGPLYRTMRLSFADAVPRAFEETWSKTVLTLNLLKKMVVGLVSTRNLSGPITIAKVAGESAESGLETFLGFLALLSVSLGVLNLLPIPVLDGGHILFYLVELAKGSPVPERVQMLGVQIGIFIVASMMLLAFYNDLTRL
ncbi:MAG: RIP metalloprotease RseP [Pseudomonadales bacterium]|jgi:regulator of sigma E protease|nr:RIP metalloprotease RseP [Pseudomonadales bacterium]